MKKMEGFITVIAIVLAMLQVVVSKWSENIGSKKAKEELKKDLTIVFKELNEDQREKFISNLDLNKDEIIEQIDKQSGELKLSLTEELRKSDEKLYNRLAILFTDLLRQKDENNPENLNDISKSKFGYSIDELMEIAKKVIKESESNYLKALAYDIRGEDTNAIKFYIKVLENNIDNDMKLLVYSRIGDLKNLNNKPDEALKYYNEAIKTFNEINLKKTDNYRDIVKVYNGMGILFAEYNNDSYSYDNAIISLENALKINRQMANQFINRDLSKNLQHLATVYKLSEDYENAKKYSKEALEIGKLC